jgi:hypothetical protein
VAELSLSARRLLAALLRRLTLLLADGPEKCQIEFKSTPR